MKPSSIVAVILCTAMLVYFACSFFKVRADIKSQKAQLETLQNLYESQVAENEALQKAIDSGDEAALAEQYARDKGYVMPDERVYVDITPGSEQ